MIAASSGVTGVDHLGGGCYTVFLTRNVTQCAVTGTVNTKDPSDPGTGSASITVSPNGASSLFVRMATPSKTTDQRVDDDRPFSVAVLC